MFSEEELQPESEPPSGAETERQGDWEPPSGAEEELQDEWEPPSGPEDLPSPRGLRPPWLRSARGAGQGRPIGLSAIPAEFRHSAQFGQPAAMNHPREARTRRARTRIRLRHLKESRRSRGPRHQPSSSSSWRSRPGCFPPSGEVLPDDTIHLYAYGVATPLTKVLQRSRAELLVAAQC